MPHDVFCELLTTISQEQLLPLKQEALTEAVQHHLTLVVNELTTKLNPYQAKLALKNKELQTLPLEDIGPREIQDVQKSISLILDEGMHFVTLANYALAIAWNTLRLDLIEQISQLKEQYQKIIGQDGGLPRNDGQEPTGLYAAFERRLNSIFSDAGPNAQISLLPDQTPAMEALVKFGVWYLPDYSDIGLLPKIAGKKQIDLRQGQEKLYLEVNQKLADIGLTTLQDLRLAGIYSKKALKDYISRKKNM